MQVLQAITEFLAELWIAIVGFIPKLIGAVVVLLIGWGAGRAIGKGVSKVLDRAGVDDVLRPTALGKALERSRITCVGFFDLIVRWFVYLIAIFAAVDILAIPILGMYMSMIVEYLPSFIAGVVILIAGTIVASYVAGMVRTICEEAGVAYVRLIADATRLFLYVVVMVLALAQMRIDVSILYIFITPLAWGLAIGLAVGLGIALGWGFKDIVTESARGWIESMTTTAKKVEEVRAKEEEKAGKS